MTIIDSRISAGETAVASVLAVLTVFLLWMIADAYGAVGIPRNDDWVYYRAAFHFADTHSFAPESSSTLLIGLVLLAYPVVLVAGHSIVALQLLVAALGSIGLWGTYMLIRGFLPRQYALISVMLLALGPMFGSLTVSLMTDVPAFTLQILTLLLGVRAMKRAGPALLAWYGLALAVGFMAFSIREYALAAGAAVALVVLRGCWFDNRCRLGPAIALTAAWIAAVTALYLWPRSLITAHQVSAAVRGPEYVLGYAWLGLQTMSLLVAPTLLFLSPRRTINGLRQVPRAIWLVPLLLTGAELALRPLLHLKSGQMVLLGNYLSFSVPYAAATAGTPPQIVPVFWMDVMLYAAAAGSVMVMSLLAVWWHGRRSGACVPYGGREDPPRVMVSIFLSLSVLGFLTVLILTPSALLDRYLLTATPLFAALLLHIMTQLGWVSSVSRRIGMVAVAAFGIWGLSTVDLAAAFDGGKWRFDRTLVDDHGLDARTIDGGYEWFGIHQPDAWGPRTREAGESWWVAQFSRRPVCAQVRFESDDLAPGERVVGRAAIQTLTGKSVTLVATARTEAPEGCQPSDLARHPGTAGE